MMNIESEKIIYKRAGIEDLETLIRFRILFLKEFFEDISDDDVRVLEGYIRDYLAQAIPQGRFISWLAEYNGEVIGCSGMIVWDTMPGVLNKTGKRGYILNMYTVPKARRNGICTTLIQKLIEEARSLGICYLHLRAGEDGIGIYIKAGFKEPSSTELDLPLLGLSQ